MVRYVIAFRDAGTPKVGLSPTIDVYIKVSDGAGAGAAPAVAEFSSGLYYFVATPAERIALRVDSEDAEMADADRYIFMEIGPNDDDLEWIKKVESNRWKIDTSAKTFTIYDDDGTTALITFNLKDADGAAAYEDVYERVPI